ncbi:hypothetical protein [Adhaeretor mobilis]|uniref:Leucine Rich repeats (2 copies) n=1 Tax=Adhaeretor mobilis TaxID=1930276 RepID=A0A517N270_9BACT|nr:hypothetical protein [Adhaeretor mobilis]QDT01232.1 Leucine Rich repeats (2 copies) [Adhaeretor mobilis]
MSTADSSDSEFQRPEYMVVLGLLPPYAETDVHKAYFERAKQAHPDHGGSASEFHQLHEAFESAMHYLEHRTDRHSWIAAQVKRYVRQTAAVELVRELGAEIEYEVIDWLRKSFGDFAELTEKTIGIKLADSPRGDALLECLEENAKSFQDLRRLDLSNCEVTDEGVSRLAGFERLQQIDLSNNPVGKQAASVLASLPALQEVVVSGTKIGWWSKRKLGGRSVLSLSDSLLTNAI